MIGHQDVWVKMSQPEVVVEKEAPIGVLRLNRPHVLNALSTSLMQQLLQGLKDLENDPEIKSIVLTGSERAFSAGADVKEMADATRSEIMVRDHLALWDAVDRKSTRLNSSHSRASRMPSSA